VLSSGEVASLVFMDSMVRLIPGVITKESKDEDSFSDAFDGKKEYPQYSRPEIFE
jgi:tRNA (guanine37-N1)-methyltransferase